MKELFLKLQSDVVPKQTLDASNNKPHSFFLLSMSKLIDFFFFEICVKAITRHAYLYIRD